MTQSPDGPDQPLSTSTPVATSDPATSTRALFAQILRRLVVVTAGVTALAVVVGLIWAGSPGMWGAVLGGVVGVIFCLTTVASMLLAEGRSPQYLAIAVLGGWLAKMVVILVILAVLRGQDFYDKVVLAGTLGAIVVASLAIEMLAVRSARIPAVTPASRAQDVGHES